MTTPPLSGPAAGRPSSPRGSRNAVVAVLAVAVVLAVLVGASLLARTGAAPLDAGSPAGTTAPADVTDPAEATDPAQATDPAGATDPAEATAPAQAADAGPCPPGPAPVADPPQRSEVPDPDAGAYTMTLATTCGDVVVSLDGAAAPQAVGSFVTLAQEGFFDASPCHRLTTAGIFVLQCGDPTATGTGGPGYRFGPIENAPADDVYPAGTLAMARVGNDGESMGSQFFLVYEDSTIPSDAAGGYTVMGQVTDGLDIVRQVAEGGLGPDGIAPSRTIGIVSVTVEESA